MKKQKNKIICILGMHRSGTSMLTRMLNICGMEIGPSSELYKNIEDNKKGHWENLKFIEINQEIIKIFSKSNEWDALPKFPPNWIDSPKIEHLKVKAQKIVEEFNHKYPLWGWKDPRTCLTLPFWKKIIPQDIYFVISIRDPVDITNSLKKRNNKKIENSLQMWSRHLDSVIKNTDKEKRSFVYFENLFTNWPYEIKKIINLVGSRHLSLNQEKIKKINSFISPKLLHNYQNFTPYFQKFSHKVFIKKIINNYSKSIEILHNSLNKINNKLQSKSLITSSLKKEKASINYQLNLMNGNLQKEKAKQHQLRLKTKILQKEKIHLMTDVVGLHESLNEIRSSKFFRLWQTANKLKGVLFHLLGINVDHPINIKDISKRANLVSCTKIINESISIVIPTRNGGELWEKNLKKILLQKNIPNKEIIVLDNNSTDKTATFAKQAGCTIYKIPENKFGHSKTRAYGVKKAKGEYIIFTVQDATLTSSYALCKLINFMKKYSLSAASGIQVPHPSADSFAQWQRYYHYTNLRLNQENLVFDGSKLNKDIYQKFIPKAKRHLLCLDDVIACYRQVVFKKISFSNKVDFAEDMDLAQKILLDKKKIGITNQTIVAHSHNVTDVYAFKRSYVETISISQLLQQKTNIFLNFHKNKKILTILLLVKKAIDNPKINSIDRLISVKTTKTTKNNPLQKILDSLYPDWKKRNFAYDQGIISSIKINIPPVWMNYYNFSKNNGFKKDKIHFSKFMANVLGNYLANIIYNTKDNQLDQKIRNLMNQRI